MECKSIRQRIYNCGSKKIIYIYIYIYINESLHTHICKVEMPNTKEGKKEIAFVEMAWVNLKKKKVVLY